MEQDFLYWHKIYVILTFIKNETTYNQCTTAQITKA